MRGRQRNYDGEILRIAKERLLRELDERNGHHAVVNNVYGGHGGGGGSGGNSNSSSGGSGSGGSIQEKMSEIDPGDYDYNVDIERRPFYHGDKIVGWNKKVKRYREKKE